MSSSDESNTNKDLSDDSEESCSDSSTFDAINQVTGYKYDPRMTQDEKNKREALEKDQQALIESRSKPVDQWCKCDNCFALLNPVENVCCHDDESCNERLNENVTCITMHDGFQATAMNEHVLSMSRGNLLQLVVDPEKRAKLRSNAPDSHRHLSYVNFRSWVSYGRRLGKGNRVVTPACVVRKIREQWPEPSGDYTGFRPSQNMIEDL